MRAKCPKCQCEFEVRSHSEVSVIAWIMIGILMGTGAGVLATLAYVLKQ